MDAAARRWSNRLHTVVALTALAFISFLVVLLQDSETHSFVRHDRRHVQLVVREGGSTPAAKPAAGSITSVSSPSSFSPALASPSATSAVASSSPVQSSSTEATSISSTIQSFSSVSSSTSVKVIPTSSTVSARSSQSAQTSTSSTALLETQFTTATSIHPAQSTDRLPATTLAITENIIPGLVQTSYSQPSPSSLGTAASTPESAAVNTSGFWRKKGAVAATFVIVALVLLAISAILIITFLKRRSTRNQSRLHDELFEKYSESDHRGPSPGPSITSTPMDAFATREVRYDSSPSFQNYVITPTHRIVHSSSPVQHPDYYNQPTSRYLAPSQTQAARSAAPPMAFRSPDTGNRDSYQHSIDSFYGAAGQPSGCNS